MDNDHPFLNGEWQTFTSSWVVAARYDRTSQTLTIRTRDKDYSTSDVTPEMALDFLRAPSHGKWVHQNLKWRTSRQLSW